MQKNVVSFLSEKITCGFVLIVACNLAAHVQSQAQDHKESPPQQEKTLDQKKPDTPPQGGSVEILSDTQGVDFRPYMKKLRFTVQAHWDPLIPDIARPPLRKSGMAIIEFAIMRDGKVAGMKLTKSSDDRKLDEAAWGAITDSIPLPTLPTEFKGDYLRMRCSFSYNPAAAEIRPSLPGSSPPGASSPGPSPISPSSKTSNPQKPQPAIVTDGTVEYISDHEGLDETYTKLALGKVQASLQNLLQKAPLGSLKTSSQVALTFSILRNGAAKDIKLKKSSGDKAFDLAVWEAIQSSSPYQDLPQQFKGKVLKVRCDIGLP